MNLTDKLGKQFVITAELDPPRGADPTATLAEAQALKNWVDAVNVSDSPMANLRMSPIAIAHLIQQNLDLEVIFHLTCRDRNVLGLQAELLGAAALGVKNILCLYGDPPSRGDHPETKGVYEVSADELAGIAKSLNSGVSKAGKELGSNTAFNIGVALNPTNPDLAKEKERMLQKHAAGGMFAQTQPVFSVDDVRRFLDAVGTPPLQVLYGVLPVRSLKMAQNVAKWANIPEALLKDIEARGKIAGMEWAKQLVQDLKAEGVAGVHLYPLGKPSVVQELLAE